MVHLKEEFHSFEKFRKNIFKVPQYIFQISLQPEKVRLYIISIVVISYAYKGLYPCLLPYFRYKSLVDHLSSIAYK